MAHPKTPIQFQQFPAQPALSLLRIKNARMAAIQLTNDKTCLVSPLAGAEQIEPNRKRITHILAPNHYHNKALADFQGQYPRAKICASKAARPRLENVTGLKISLISTLAKQLPTQFSILEPAGLKTGELWIRFKAEKTIGWLVVDAFCGKAMTARTEHCQTPAMLSTFPRYGIENLSTYRNWVLQQIRKDKPQVVIPCHGCTISSSNLPAKLTNLVESI